MRLSLGGSFVATVSKSTDGRVLVWDKGFAASRGIDGSWAMDVKFSFNELTKEFSPVSDSKEADSLANAARISLSELPDRAK
jgi:hypothetical protein